MKKDKTRAVLPKFKTEEEERRFWSTHDMTDYIEYFQPVEFDLSRLKPSTHSITVRLPASLIASLKTLANKKDVPYQSLMKIYLAEKVKEEFRISSA
jgi:predicted DNA binding CopG/RHH family protein